MSLFCDCSSSMLDIVREAEKLCGEGVRVLGDGPPADSCWQCRGAEPSLAQYMEGLQDLHAMLRDELALKMAIVAKISYDIGAEDFDSLLKVFAAQPNVDLDYLGSLMQQVAEISK